MCYHSLWKRVEGEGVEKTWATFLSKPQHLICKKKVVGSNRADGTFFLEIIPFGHMFLLSIFKTAVTRHPNHLWRWDLSEIKRPSSGNSNIAVVYRYLLLSEVKHPSSGNLNIVVVYRYQLLVPCTPQTPLNPCTTFILCLPMSSLELPVCSIEVLYCMLCTWQSSDKLVATNFL